MHISEGILSVPVLVASALVAVGLVTLGLRKLPWNNIMHVAILSAAFFVASLVHIPIGPFGCAHLILNGLMGAVLGWACVPAIAIALFLQALLFQFGGFTTLGVNICVMALPAVVCGALFRPWLRPPAPKAWAAFGCGILAVALSTVLASLALALSGKEFILSAQALAIGHIPVMIVEGLATIVVVRFLAKTSPDLLLFSAVQQSSVTVMLGPRP